MSEWGQKQRMRSTLVCLLLPGADIMAA